MALPDVLPMFISDEGCDIANILSLLISSDNVIDESITIGVTEYLFESM